MNPALDALVERASSLAPGRRLLGLTGPPGVGKSTLATILVSALPSGYAVLVPMDGFHLADVQLGRLGRRSRKGAPDTFDAAGYVSLLRRLRSGAEEVVYAPEFRRSLEEPVAGAIAVPPTVELVVTEGNYLLGDGPFAGVRPLLDEVWYLSLPSEQRVSRLVARHMEFGRSEAEARERAMGSDQRNAELIEATSGLADLIVSL
jgi:pantothenate kinase